MKRWRRLSISYLLTVLIPMLAAVPCAHSDDKKNAAQQTKSSDQTKAYVAPTDPGLYVGSDTCKTCHLGEGEGRGIEMESGA
jgi:cytochrome c5